MANNLVTDNHPHSGGVKVNHVQTEERPIDQEDIFIMERGGATGGGELQTTKEVIYPLIDCKLHFSQLFIAAVFSHELFAVPCWLYHFAPSWHCQSFPH